jgi:hypothetical protein
MFENVPERLTNYLRSAAVDFDRESFFYFAAAYLGIFYLRKNLTNPETSDFLNIKRTSRGGIWYGHSGRVILIGETLFLMRSCPGFSEFCRRLQGRDLRSTYFEMYAARMFFEGAYEVRAKPEVGVRREDFDFQAIAEGEVVNVEVTALTAGAFSAQTVENALHQKRKQLPDTDAAIIFCILPESWATTPNLGRALGLVTKRFFDGTRRISAVVFVIEMHVDIEKDGPVGHLSIHHVCLLHPNPRHPIRSLAFFKETWQTDISSFELPTQSRENEFFRWVDSIFASRNETLP